MFINCTQHELTEKQRAAAAAYGEVAELRVLAPDLFARLAQIRADTDVVALADEVADFFCEDHDEDTLHLPIGDPAFMWALAQEFERFGASAPRVVFSRSERRSMDVPQPDGSVRKSAVFDFVKFVKFAPGSRD